MQEAKLWASENRSRGERSRLKAVSKLKNFLIELGGFPQKDVIASYKMFKIVVRVNSKQVPIFAAQMCTMESLLPLNVQIRTQAHFFAYELFPKMYRAFVTHPDMMISWLRSTMWSLMCYSYPKRGVVNPRRCSSQQSKTNYSSVAGCGVKVWALVCVANGAMKLKTFLSMHILVLMFNLHGRRFAMISVFFSRRFRTATRCQSYVGRATTTAGGPGLGTQGQEARPGPSLVVRSSTRSSAGPSLGPGSGAAGHARPKAVLATASWTATERAPHQRLAQPEDAAARTAGGARRARSRTRSRTKCCGLLSRSLGPLASAGRPSRVRGTCGACVAPRPAARHRPPPRRMDVDDPFWLKETRVLRRSTALLRWRWPRSRRRRSSTKSHCCGTT